MPRLDFVDGNIKKSSLPKLKDAVTYISSAINNIPSGPDNFESKKALNCRDTLNNVKKGINNKSTNLKKIIDKIIKEEEYQTRVASVLSIHNIKVRTNKNIE